MNLSETKYLAKPFSHIYIENAAADYPLTKIILSRFPGANIIRINHYKDIFNRSGQDFLAQKYSKSLILAKNNGELIYKGAKVCQDFDNRYFYYTSNIMNCVYDCEYCYLQGMYPSGNIVIFVNFEDYFSKLESYLANHEMYLCISYDTDLLALENITGLTQKWIDFTKKHENLKIEIRTKSAYDITSLNNITERVIFAWTLSPDIITSKFEHMTPGLNTRLNAVKKALSVTKPRLCLDPVIYVPDYKKIYSDFYQKIFCTINSEDILDCSLGLFRISSSYLKSMRKKRVCEITAYPYTTCDNVCSYEKEKSDEMLDFARLELSRYISSEKIYIPEYD